MNIEILESRVAPAVLTSFAAGLLTITGDDSDSTITVAEQPSPDAYHVTGADAGQTADFTGVTRIAVHLAGGTDTLTINGASMAGTTLRGGFDITSSGKLTVAVNDDVNLAGTLSLEHGGTAALRLDLNGSQTTIGQLAITDGSGDAIFRFFPVHILRNVLLNTGAGADTLDTTGTIIGGALTFLALGAGGTDSLVTNHTVIGGSVRFESAGENETLSIQNGSVVRGNLTGHYTGTGSHGFNVVTSFVTGSVSLLGSDADESSTIEQSTIGGGVTFTGGEGSNTLAFNASRIGGSVKQTGGTGTQILSLSNNSEVLGSATLLAPLAPTNAVTLSTAFVHGKVSLTGGDGNDTISVTNLHSGGSFKASVAGGTNSLTTDGLFAKALTFLATGTSTNTLDLKNSALASLKFIGGSNAETFKLTNVTLRGALTALLGDGAASVTINDSFVGGATLFNLGAGGIGFTVESTSDNISTVFAGAFTFLSGDGGKNIALGNSATDPAYFLGHATLKSAGGGTLFNDDFAVFFGGETLVGFM